MATDLELIRSPGYPALSTVSPSGRYALAWGVPGVTGPGKLLQDNKLDTTNVRNYLVERRTLSIVGVLPLHSRRGRWYQGEIIEYKSGGNHFPSRNHSSMAAFWSQAEDWVLVWHEGVWWYEALYLGHRTTAGFHFIEIGDTVEDIVRAELHRRHPRAYERAHQADGRNPAVDIHGARLLPPRLFLNVRGGVAKQDGDPLDFQGIVEMHFLAAAESIQARITSLHLKPSGNGFW